MCTESAKLTHFHISGVNGALLQAMSIKLALQTEGQVDPVKFVDSLLQQIQPFEDITQDQQETSKNSQT